MSKKIKYISFLFLCIIMILSKKTYADGIIIDNTPSEPNRLSQMLECNYKLRWQLGSFSVCNKWVIKISEKNALKGDLSRIYPTCVSRITIDSSTQDTNSIDNLGFSRKWTDTHYTYGYRCSDGSILSTNDCAVPYTEYEDCPSDASPLCEYCDLGFFLCMDSRNWYDACTYRYGAGSYAKQGNQYMFHFYCVIPKIDRTSTYVQTGATYTHHLIECFNPTIKNLNLLKIYDPNKIYQ